MSDPRESARYMGAIKELLFLVARTTSLEPEDVLHLYTELRAEATGLGQPYDRAIGKPPLPGKPANRPREVRLSARTLKG